MSKKRLFAATILLLGLIATLFILLAPRAMRLESVRRRVAMELSKVTGSDLDFSRLDLVWLPTPHFTFRNTRIIIRGNKITIPEIRVNPGAWFLLGRSRHLRSIELIRPTIDLRGIVPGKTSRPTIKMPVTKISIRHGSIRIPPLDSWTSTAVTIKDIDLEIRDRKKSIDLSLTAGSDISGDLFLNLVYDKKIPGYRGKYLIEAINPAFLAPGGAKGRIRILENPITLKGDITGGKDNFSLSANGSFPCFRYVPRSGKEVAINCGSTKFNIVKKNNHFKIKISHLEISRPGLNISGIIERITPALPARNQAPVWNINIQGKDIDLTAVRADLLRLWPRNHVVKTVTDVVAGGRAKTGSFAFKGPASRFAHLRDMRITADARGADIHPPHTNLYLTNASGPISIENGYLKGSGLTTSLGNSTGDNGTLYLDLLRRDHAFILDLDIDADLAALPPILDGLVKNKKFRSELKHFKQVAGRGRAHLHLGDTLHNIKASVRVHDARGNAFYDRLPWPFTLGDGTLVIAPGSVSWQGINGRAGPHRLSDLSGAVKWTPEGTIKFKILSGSGEIDSADLLATMRSHRFLPKIFGRTIKKISGPLKIRDFRIKGDPRRPEGWRYAMEINAAGVRWQSELIPGSFLTEKGRALITNKVIKIRNSKTWSLEQPVTLNADLRHHNFKGINGRLTIDGSIRERLASWIVAKGWLPPILKPVTPITLQGLKINFGRGRTGITGTIKAGLAGEDGAAVDLDISGSAHDLVLKKITVRDHGSSGSLNLTRTLENGRRITRIGWRGDLSGSTLVALLADPGFTLEGLSGDCRIVLESDTPPLITGRLLITGLAPDDGNSRKTRMAILDLNGDRRGQPEIKKLILDRNGQTIEIKGGLFPRETPPEYDITARSPLITWNNLMGIKDDLRYDDKNNSSGRISFDIDELRNIAGPVAGNGIDMSPAIGEIRFTAGKWQTLKFKESRLCGLEFEGIIHPDGSDLESSFNLFSEKGTLPEFEKVLPCLGFKNDLIKGRVNVDASLKGKNSFWDKGRLNLYSKKGFIRRLSLLSKALSLLNITGLVSGSFLKDLDRDGFTYSELDLKSHVDKNRLIVDRAIIRGSGLNIFAQGWVNIKNRECEIIMLLAPLKTLDTIVGNLPIIGPAVGGKDTALIALPVKISGKIDDPVVETMPAKEVGNGIVRFITRTLKLPFAIFSPLIEGKTKKGTDTE